MSIADKLRKVLEIKNDIKASLEEVGVEVTDDFSTYATEISNLSSGSEPEIEILPDEPPVVEIPEIPEIPEIEPWVQPSDWVDLKAKIERHSYEEYPYRIALLLEYDGSDSIELGTTGNTTCKCITVDDGDRGTEYDVEEGNYTITHSWDGYTGTNGYRWIIYHFDTPEANFINFPTSCVQAIFDGINASLSGRLLGSSNVSYSSFNIKNTRMVSMESINGGSIDDVNFKESRTIRYISPNIFGNNVPSSLEGMFSGCYNLEYSPILDATRKLDLGDLFYQCYNLRYVSPIINIDRATDFSRMFYNCSSLTSIPELNTTNGTNFGDMFYNCSSLVTIPELNTTNGTDFSYMFYGCSSLVTIPELNTTNVTNFSYMFNGCSSLTSIPLIDTTNGTNFSYMFQYCSSLVTIPELNTINGTSFSNMFNGCSSLTSIPDLNCENAKTIYSIFSGASSLKNAPLLYAPKATSTERYYFQNCYHLRVLGGVKIPSVTSISEIFGSSSNYQYFSIVDLGVWDLSSITASSVEFPFSYLTRSFKLEGRVQFAIMKHWSTNYVLIEDFSAESIEKDQNFSYWISLTKQSLLNILNALVTLEEGTTKTLTLHTTYHMSKLTDEEKAIAINKGWTLSEYNA